MRRLDESRDLGAVRAQQRVAPVGVGAQKVDDGTREQELVGLGERVQTRRGRHGRRGAEVEGGLGGHLAQAVGRGDAVGHRAAASGAAAAELGLDEAQRALVVAVAAVPAQRRVAARADGAVDAPVVLGARGAAQRVLDEHVDDGLDRRREELDGPIGVVVRRRRLVGQQPHLAIVEQRPVVAPRASALGREPRAHGVHGDGLAVVGDGHLGLARLGEGHR